MMRAKGYSIVEWMVAMVIGIFLTAGLLSLYVTSNEGTDTSRSDSELQENGRIAMDLLLNDLRMAGFWGDYSGLPLTLDGGVTLSTAASALSTSSDCLNNLGTGSFPTATANLRAIWTLHVNSSGSKGTSLACITLPSGSSLSPDSDILDIKRLKGAAISDATTLDTNRFYAATTVSGLRFFNGSETRPTTGEMQHRQIWEYLRHIYYIRVENNVPTLHMYYLANSMTDTAVVRGIEKIKIILAVDNTTTPDGIIDAYIEPESVTQKQWDERRVLGARLFVLVRATEADNQYTNSNTYTMGSLSYTPADHYRRLLLQSTVMFNGSGDRTE